MKIKNTARMQQKLIAPMDLQRSILESIMLLVGKLAAGRYFWLRHDQVVGRERPACAKLSKERCRTHINLGSTYKARKSTGSWL